MNNNNSMMKTDLYKRAECILKEAEGENAEFREGQYEAIESVLNNKRTLVVQKTGWGKSMVYFISAKMTEGMTVIISPLLVLMDNQKMAAERMGLACLTVNSKLSGEERKQALEDLKDGKYKILFTTPETLYKKDLRDIMPSLNISLFVIDECHCISDWGHDFRLEYGKLNRVIRNLPAEVSLLGTTATANDRVIKDLEKQFGENTVVLRGPLTRESLHIEILKLKTKAERYAWIKKNINKIPGTGIIYCLTQKDCVSLSCFLNENGIDARPYYSGDGLDKEDDEGISENDRTEKLFADNKIKVIVATIKLGMGYDKDDIGFVIHFQRPGSVVSYYQQIGRAGRKEGSEAYCYLMTGGEDTEIIEYFIKSAFPTEEQESDVIRALENNPEGMSLGDLQNKCNISLKALEKTLNMLQNQGIVESEWDGKTIYKRTLNKYKYAAEHYNSVREAKIKELRDMEAFTEETGCLSKSVVNKLNDYTALDCGKCSNCLNHGILDVVEYPDSEEVCACREFIGGRYIEIEPRKQWRVSSDEYDKYGFKNSKISNLNETGIALAKYGEAGYGEMVKYDKYNAEVFRNELVEKAVSILESKKSEGYSYVVNVPSRRNTKVGDFAKKVAERLGLNYLDVLDKVPGEDAQQKDMLNSYFQCENALSSIRLKKDTVISGSVILIDDMVDSRWTLTVCGYLLKKAGAEKVFPFCLADSSVTEG